MFKTISTLKTLIIVGFLLAAVVAPLGKIYATDVVNLNTSDVSDSANQADKNINNTLAMAACKPEYVHFHFWGPATRSYATDENVFVDWWGLSYVRVSSDCAREVKTKAYITDTSPSPWCGNPNKRSPDFRDNDTRPTDNSWSTDIDAGIYPKLTVNYFGPEPSLVSDLNGDTIELAGKPKCMRTGRVTIHGEGYYRNNLNQWVKVFCQEISLVATADPTGDITYSPPTSVLAPQECEGDPTELL